ncbi:hypothetical protein QR680_018595 [Steinernema hermaphroditum]|uniref:Uncharacterized protein n=1 Tax=Steinernema hermaphroditum TaxID=289476 RepID=A0AA39HKQ0_9BILA|nr:hypothetical protein QR680_018595 [Steinernema hermaphroditum]
MDPHLKDGITSSTLTFQTDRQNWRDGVDATQTTSWEVQSDGGHFYDYLETKTLKMRPRTRAFVRVFQTQG